MSSSSSTRKRTERSDSLPSPQTLVDDDDCVNNNCDDCRKKISDLSSTFEPNSENYHEILSNLDYKVPEIGVWPFQDDLLHKNPVQSLKRLVDVISRPKSNKLKLVAPPGFGKTQLLQLCSSYLEGNDEDFASYPKLQAGYRPNFGEYQVIEIDLKGFASLSPTSSSSSPLPSSSKQSDDSEPFTQTLSAKLKDFTFDFSSYEAALASLEPLKDLKSKLCFFLDHFDAYHPHELLNFLRAFMDLKLRFPLLVASTPEAKHLDRLTLFDSSAYFGYTLPEMQEIFARHLELLKRVSSFKDQTNDIITQIETHFASWDASHFLVRAGRRAYPFSLINQLMLTGELPSPPISPPISMNQISYSSVSDSGKLITIPKLLLRHCVQQKWIRADRHHEPLQLVQGQSSSIKLMDRELAFFKLFEHLDARLTQSKFGKMDVDRNYAPIYAVYGGPGSGKSRFLDEIAHPTKRLQLLESPKLDIDSRSKTIIRESVGISVTFNGEMQLYKPPGNILPSEFKPIDALALRIFYSYFIDPKALPWEDFAPSITNPLKFADTIDLIISDINPSGADPSNCSIPSTSSSTSSSYSTASSFHQTLHDDDEEKADPNGTDSNNPCDSGQSGADCSNPSFDRFKPAKRHLIVCVDETLLGVSQRSTTSISTKTGFDDFISRIGRLMESRTCVHFVLSSLSLDIMQSGITKSVRAIVPLLMPTLRPSSVETLFRELWNNPRYEPETQLRFHQFLLDTAGAPRILCYSATLLTPQRKDRSLPLLRSCYDSAHGFRSLFDVCSTRHLRNALLMALRGDTVSFSRYDPGIHHGLLLMPEDSTDEQLLVPKMAPALFFWIPLTLPLDLIAKQLVEWVREFLDLDCPHTDYVGKNLEKQFFLLLKIRCLVLCASPQEDESQAAASLKNQVPQQICSELDQEHVPSSSSTPPSSSSLSTPSSSTSSSFDLSFPKLDTSSVKLTMMEFMNIVQDVHFVGSLFSNNYHIPGELKTMKSGKTLLSNPGTLFIPASSTFPGLDAVLSLNNEFGQVIMFALQLKWSGLKDNGKSKTPFSLTLLAESIFKTCLYHHQELSGFILSGRFGFIFPVIRDISRPHGSSSGKNYFELLAPKLIKVFNAAKAKFEANTSTKKKADFWTLDAATQSALLKAAQQNILIMGKEHLLRLFTPTLQSRLAFSPEYALLHPEPPTPSSSNDLL